MAFLNKLIMISQRANSNKEHDELPAGSSAVIRSVPHGDDERQLGTADSINFPNSAEQHHHHHGDAVRHHCC